MSLGKKISFLFLCLIVLMVYTVSAFDYRKVDANIKSEDTQFFNTQAILDYTTALRDRALVLKEELLEKVGMKTEEELIVEQSVNLDQPKQNEDELVNKLTVEKHNMVDSYEDNEKEPVKVTENITKNDENEVNSTDISQEKIDKNQEISKNIENLENSEKSIDSSNENNELSNTIQTPKQIQSMIDEILVENKISFKRRSVKITKESLVSVEKIAQILKDNSDLKVEIAGHTDSRGKASLNKRISQDRANSVKNALVKLGVDKKRLKAVGYGEQFPIAKDDKDGLSEINRRVEINIEGVKK